MIQDISITLGQDLSLVRGDILRAGNVLAVQLGSLEYAQDFGVDLRYFLESEFRIQNASFKAYLVQRLLEHQINIVNVLSTIEPLIERMTFMIGESDSGQELIS